jgi:2-phospho-L-lactate guanylyltransferase
MLIGIPIRSFATAKERLSEHLTATQRRDLAVDMADHAASVASVVAEVMVMTGDGDVRQWAAARSLPTLDDGGSLDGAGQAIANHTGHAAWGVLHADLPKLSTADIDSALVGFADRGCVIAPSWDGGTSLIMSRGTFRFSYGPGSFHRHLRQRPSAAVIIRAGLALDVDEPEHLDWLRDVKLGL